MRNRLLQYPVKFKAKLSYDFTVHGKPLKGGDFVEGNLVIDTDGGRRYITERIYWHEDGDDCDCDDAQLYHGVEHDDANTFLVLGDCEISIAELADLLEARAEGRLRVEQRGPK